jgi:hypothetical protein
MGATYRHDYKAFGKFVLNAPFMQEAMKARAEKVKAAAVADTATYSDTGHYAESFKVESGVNGGANHDRAYGRVKNTDPAAAVIEFGHLSGKEGDPDRKPVEGHHTLVKALDAAGGR